jgi:galactose mutarotase-like enzyme
MPKRTWILTDLEQDTFIEQISVGPDQVGGAATGYSVNKRILRGGRRDGVDAVEIDNGRFRFVVLPTRGMGLWRAWLADMVLGWKSPVKGPVHPALVPLGEPGGLGWLSGFDEFMCRCGLENNGAPEFGPNGTLRYGLHGRIANSPAHHVELTVDGDQGTISLTGVVDETRLFFNKMRLTSTVTTRVGEPGLTISDTVTNLSAEPGELQLLYHTNFGLPLASGGAKAILPVRRMAPRDAVAVENVPQWDTYDPEIPGSQEVVFFFDLAARDDGSTQALLRSAAGDRGVSLKFNKRQLPCFTLWKNRQAAADGYVTGLEPAINFPNGRAFEKASGRVAVLAPGESRTYEMTIEAHPDRAAVEAAERAVAAIQGNVKPEILAKHDPAWSAG